MSKFSFHKTDSGTPLKLWDSHAPFEDGAMQQLRNTAALPFIHKHVAGMPDVHWGMGATIGSVVATKGAIVPAAVGVDIGCGMMAYQTTLKASDLPDTLAPLRSSIEVAVPHGRTNNGGPGDEGAWDNAPASALASWGGLISQYNKIIERHPKIVARHPARNTVNHLGTLGGGNHFIEICLDEDDGVWVMLHSGSRGVGNRIGSYFIRRAKEEMERYHIDKFLPDKDLSYLSSTQRSSTTTWRRWDGRRTSPWRTGST